MSAGFQETQPETAPQEAENSQPAANQPVKTTAEFLAGSPLSLSSQAVEEHPLFLGAEEGGAVSDVVEIRPNQNELPGIRKVAYYLNGTKSGKVYQSPFVWGGPTGSGITGFDTKTLSDGGYSLDMVVIIFIYAFPPLVLTSRFQ